MSPTRRQFIMPGLALLLLLAPALRAAESASAAEIKRITDRYNLTSARIHTLLDQRQNPTPLPANPPNPFYQVAAVKEGASPGEAVVPGRGGGTTAHTPDLAPEVSDLSDEDQLKKYAATLKVGGVIVRNGTANLTINNTPCKVGDVITAGSKDHPVYLKLIELTAADFTLGLNDARIILPLKK